MQYLGIDVHSKNCVWCLLDNQGKRLATGKTPTMFLTLQALGTSLRLTTSWPLGTATPRPYAQASARTSTCSTTHAAATRRWATSAQPPSRRPMINTNPKLPWQRNLGVHFFLAIPVTRWPL